MVILVHQNREVLRNNQHSLKARPPLNHRLLQEVVEEKVVLVVVVVVVEEKVVVGLPEGEMLAVAAELAVAVKKDEMPE
jgi:hypothetical protein